MAPTFDHGNTLGFTVPENKVQKLLDNEDILRKWVEKGRNKYFQGKPRMADVAVEALSSASIDSREYFRCRLLDLSLKDVTDAAKAFPKQILSAERARLACKIVDVNRGRLLDAISAG